MPFGASSCTSLAQRQSDAICRIARVSIGKEASDPEDNTAQTLDSILPIERVNAKLVPMPDDFFAVLPRDTNETDSSVILRAHEEAKRFDLYLKNLGLPKAPEKDQPPGFTTT